MLSPSIRPYSIEAFFYLPRAVLVLLSCSTRSLCQSCLASFFPALHTVHSLAHLPLVLEEHADYFSPYYFCVISVCFVRAGKEVQLLHPACERAHSLASGVLQGCSVFGACWVVAPVCSGSSCLLSLMRAWTWGILPCVVFFFKSHLNN